MIRCICGQESENGSDLWQCRKCGSTFHLPSNYEGDFELVSGDLSSRYRSYLGLLIFVSILAQCMLAYWLSGSGRAGIVYLFPFLGVFMVAYGFSDELRVVPLISNYYAIAFGVLLFEVASWIALFPALRPTLIIIAIGLGAALLGLAITLASARPPLRYPFLVLDAWRVWLRKPKTSSPREVAHLLPKAIMLLRSFPADTMPVEQVDMEFGHDRVFFTATIEDTIRLFAHQNGLSLIKVGGETRSEGAVNVAAGDDSWHDVVRKIIESSAAVILIPGDTPGLKWELEQLVQSQLFPAQVTVIFPKLPTAELDLKWNAFRALTTRCGIPLPALPADREWQPLAAHFEPSHKQMIAVSNSRWTTGPCRRAYWYALRKCLVARPEPAVQPTEM